MHKRIDKIGNVCYYLLTKTQGGDTVNIIELKVKLMRSNMSVEDLAQRMGINKVTLYRKIKGESQFDLNEIKEVAAILNLTQNEIFSIFFTSQLT